MSEPAERLDPETRADALDVLGDVARWRLTEERWTRVEESVEALHAALSAGDGDRFREAVHELELAGPVRVTRIGSAPLVEASDSLQRRTGHLVHALTSEPGAGRSGADEEPAGADEDGSGRGGAGTG